MRTKTEIWILFKTFPHLFLDSSWVTSGPWLSPFRTSTFPCALKSFSCWESQRQSETANWSLIPRVRNGTNWSHDFTRCKEPRKCSLPIWQEQNHMGVSKCSGSSPQLLSSVVIFQLSLLLTLVSDVFLYFSESLYFMFDQEFCILLLSLPFSSAAFNVWWINYYIIIFT